MRLSDDKFCNYFVTNGIRIATFFVPCAVCVVILARLSTATVNTGKLNVWQLQHHVEVSITTQHTIQTRTTNNTGTYNSYFTPEKAVANFSIAE